MPREHMVPSLQIQGNHGYTVKRVKDAKAVEIFKQNLNPKQTIKTNRSKVTAFIASQKSHQEFIPLLENFIHKAHIELLHWKNNACALARQFVLKLAISWSNLSSSVSSFSQVPLHTLFFRYVGTMKPVPIGRISITVLLVKTPDSFCITSC